MMTKVEPKPTTPQIRKFFALCKELGVSDVTAKERAKAHFRVDSFTKIGQNQISELIEKLQVSVQKKQPNLHTHEFICRCGVSLIIKPNDP